MRKSSVKFVVVDNAKLVINGNPLPVLPGAVTYTIPGTTRCLVLDQEFGFLVTSGKYSIFYNNGYPVIRRKQKHNKSNTIVGRFIAKQLGLGLSGKWCCGYKDRNPLNCRAANLLPMNRANFAARKTPRCRPAGLMKGVYRTAGGRFAARLTRNGKCFYSARVDSPEEAAVLYDELALRHFGKHARTNVLHSSAILGETAINYVVKNKRRKQSLLSELIINTHKLYKTGTKKHK